MRMTWIEKRFVNSERHSRTVATNAERLVRLTTPAPGATYLDVGCGNGRSALHLAQALDLEVAGVDVDPDQIRAAAAASGGRPGTRFRTADATRLPFPDDHFDIVATYKTTHHIPDWPLVLEEMYRVLKPGGHWIYSDLVVPRGVAALASRFPWRSVGFPTVRRIESWIASCGLCPVHRAVSGMVYETVCRREAAANGRQPVGDV